MKDIKMKNISELKIVPDQEFKHYQMQGLGNGNFALCGSNDKKTCAIVQVWNENDNDCLEQMYKALQKANCFDHIIKEYEKEQKENK